MSSLWIHVVSFLIVGGLICVDGLSSHRRSVRAICQRPAVFTEPRTITPANRSLCPETPETRPPTRVNTTDRLAALRTSMASSSLHAYLILITDEHGASGTGYDGRLQYISGFSGSNGYAVVTMTEAALLTDGRYFAQADIQMDCNWILMHLSQDTGAGQGGYPTSTEWLLEKLISNSSVGAYPNYVGTSTWQWYESNLQTKNIAMVSVSSDLVDTIWTDPSRPAIPNNPLIVHTLNFTGKSWKEKFGEVRMEMANAGVDGLVVTVLEQVAWLFNLRGSDRTDSLFYTYAILFHNNARLYVRDVGRLLSDVAVRQHLEVNANGLCASGDPSNCINVYEYSQVITDVTNLALTNKLWIDPTANYAIYNAAGSQRLVSDSPIELMKAIKNTVERQHFENCILRDSAAVVEFAAFFEKQIEAGEQWTEMSASAKMREIRSGYEHFKGLSFESISAFGSNAAIIHYRPAPESDRQIDQSSVYLLDSGGQYLDGTTDVTRTFHYGTPTDKQKDAYTRVLMGQIDLAMTVWPAGLYGRDIDARARTPIWQNGWDYNHGTGHGIGYFLSVHEGPGRINLGYNSMHKPLYEGMFFSDEPGYYEDGNFGVRLETLVTVVKANTTYNFDGKQFLGFKPLTFVPYEPHLINFDIMSPAQIAWLNDFHRECREKVGKYLQDRGKQEAYNWVMARTGNYEVSAAVNRHRAGCILMALVSVLFSVTMIASRP